MSDVVSTVIVFEINYVVVIYWQEELALNISQLVLNFRNEKSGIVEETNIDLHSNFSKSIIF